MEVVFLSWLLRLMKLARQRGSGSIFWAEATKLIEARRRNQRTHSEHVKRESPQDVASGWLFGAGQRKVLDDLYGRMEHRKRNELGAKVIATSIC